MDKGQKKYEIKPVLINHETTAIYSVLSNIDVFMKTLLFNVIVIVAYLGVRSES